MDHRHQHQARREDGHRHRLRELRLKPREEPIAIEMIDPLTRGSLFHEVQFGVLSKLRADGLLPVTCDTVTAARDCVDGILDEVAARYREKLHPAIPRVWDDGINGIRADLREWLRKDEKPVPPEVSRLQLWRAALVLFARHPILGIGPDNYRLSYGEVLGLPQADSNVHSNNLYLEILAGCGVLGLMAFALLLWRIRWRGALVAPSLAVFLIHGAFDSFLMTTPLYFAFWIIVAQASAPE